MKTKVKSNNKYYLILLVLVAIIIIINVVPNKTVSTSRLQVLKNKELTTSINDAENCELCILELRLLGYYDICDITAFYNTLFRHKGTNYLSIEEIIAIRYYGNHIKNLEDRIISLLIHMPIKNDRFDVDNIVISETIFNLNCLFYLYHKDNFKDDYNDTMLYLENEIQDNNVTIDYYNQNIKYWDTDDLTSNNIIYALHLLKKHPYISRQDTHLNILELEILRMIKTEK